MSKKVLIMGVGRSGTTAIYSLLQRIMEDQYPDDVDYVYEPFLWDRSAFNGLYDDVRPHFRWASSISYEGIYHHKKLPLFLKPDEPVAEASRAWMSASLTTDSGKSHYLGKAIRASGRLPLIQQVSPDTKIIFVLRNPLDVLNSSLYMFSFYGDEFYASDYPRFISECRNHHGLADDKTFLDSLPLHREYDYWYYSNLAFINSAALHDNIFMMSHEAYVRDGAELVKHICEFSGLSYKPYYAEWAEKVVGPVNNKLTSLSLKECKYLIERMDDYSFLLERASVPFSDSVKLSLSEKYNDRHFRKNVKKTYELDSIIHTRNRLRVANRQLREHNREKVVNRFVEQSNLRASSNKFNYVQYIVDNSVVEPDVSYIYSTDESIILEDINKLIDYSRPVNAQIINVNYRAFGFVINDDYSVAFHLKWYRKQQLRIEELMSQLRSLRKHDQCVIVNHSPLFEAVDKNSLMGQDVFISNESCEDAFLASVATYYSTTSLEIATKSGRYLHALPCIKLLPMWASPLVGHDDNVFFICELIKYAFKLDSREWVSPDTSVYLFNMQLAYAIGYKKVLLVGFDDDFFASEESAYSLVGKEFSEGGREVVNCYLDSKSNIYRVACLENELIGHEQASLLDAQKILVISSAAIGSLSHPGTLMQRLFDGVSRSLLMNVYTEPESQSYQDASSIRIERGITREGINRVISQIKAFSPDIIYYCITRDPEYFCDVAYQIIGSSSRPVVTHFIDDWIMHSAIYDGGYFDYIQPKLDRLIDEAAINLSVCQEMSSAYEGRYGRPFSPVSNYIDSDYNFHGRPRKNCDSVYVIRYFGGFLGNVSQQSVMEFAWVVSRLKCTNIAVQLEIYTTKADLHIAESMCFSASVSAHLFVDRDAYMHMLGSADLLLIAYDFDGITLDYIRYSMAAELPDYIASRTPVFIYGHKEVATVSYCREHGLAEVLSDQSLGELERRLKTRIANHSTYDDEATSYALGFYTTHHSKALTKNKFYLLLNNAANYPSPIKLNFQPFRAIDKRSKRFQIKKLQLFYFDSRAVLRHKLNRLLRLMKII